MPAVLTLVATASACSKDPPPPQAPAPAPVYTPPPAETAAAPTAVPGQLATPGPTALSCQNDSQCMTHHCNMQYGKCAYPCVSDTDCLQGSTCVVALGPVAICMPKAAGQ